MGTPYSGPEPVGHMTGDLAAMEAVRLREQLRVDSLKTQAERNALGQFATPPALANEIASYVRLLWENRTDRIRFLEPAVGSGSFYSAFRATFPNESWETACGIELDSEFARAAKAVWGPVGLTVINGDFTRFNPPQMDVDRANLIVTNPPYVRHHHIDRFEKTRLKTLVRTQLGLEINGLAGLYCYFLLLADVWLAESGIGVWLIPSEFMEVNYGAVIRDYLTNNVSLLRIHRFDPNMVQFDDALVTSAIVVFQKTAPQTGHTVSLSYGGSLTRPSNTTAVLTSTLRASRKWTRYFSDTDEVIDVPGRSTLSSLFKIQRGIATGNNNFFVLSRSDARDRGVPEHCLRPILPSPRFLKSPIVEAAADGYPLLNDQLAVIDCSLPEVEIRERYPEFWKYLQQGAEQGVNEGYLASKRHPWYRQEQRPPAPFLCTYMGRSNGDKKPFRFIWNRSRAIAANVYLLLYPRGALAVALEQDPSLYSTVFELLQGIDVVDILGEGRMYGGGLHKLEPKELGRVSASKILDAIESIRSQDYVQASLFTVV